MCFCRVIFTTQEFLAVRNSPSVPHGSPAAQAAFDWSLGVGSWSSRCSHMRRMDRTMRTAPEVSTAATAISAYASSVDMGVSSAHTRKPLRRLEKQPRAGRPFGPTSREDADVDMLKMRVDPVVRYRVEIVDPAEDLPPMDHVVSTWMREHGCQQGDYIQAIDIEVYGVDYPTTVWVVVARSGLVIGVAEPPIGVSLPEWPPSVHLTS